MEDVEAASGKCRWASIHVGEMRGRSTRLPDLGVERGREKKELVGGKIGHCRKVDDETCYIGSNKKNTKKYGLELMSSGVAAVVFRSVF